MIKIESIQPENCKWIAQLHLSNLRTPFCGRGGKGILECYYQALSHQAGACGFVAKESNKIVGYVCGIWEPKLLRRELFRSQWLKLGWWIIIQAINKPSVFFNLIRRYQNSTSIEDEGSAYELRPIVVLPEYRRKGVAGLLLNILIEDAARRGFDRIILYTEDDNIAAQSFYIKEKFNLVTKVSRNGTIYHRYERKLESVAS